MASQVEGGDDGKTAGWGEGATQESGSVTNNLLEAISGRDASP